MAANDARPVPRKNAAWRMYFAIRNSSGALITSWTGADSEISKDGAAFADCTDEATETGTSGCGYLDFTASEMNADAVTIKITVTNAGALPIVQVVYPEEAGDYRADVTHFGGTAGTFASGVPTVNLAANQDVRNVSGTLPAVTLATSQPNYAPATEAQVQAAIVDELSNRNYEAALADIPTVAEFEARTLAAASYGTAANQTTILARLGSWTGTGINTILGAFRALAGKASGLTPSDISTGTTFDNTLDSLEAVRDRGDAAWASGGGGSGARTITITVNDGTTVLQNARVRLTEGANTFTALTNASGVATLNVDDATYTVAITKSGYSYAGTTLVVDDDKVRTYSMTATSVTPPTDPALCAVTIPIVNQFGAALSGEPVEIRFNEFATGADTTAIVLSPPPALTSAAGLVEVNLLRDGKYSVFYGQDDYKRRLDFTVPDASSFVVGE